MSRSVSSRVPIPASVSVGLHPTGPQALRPSPRGSSRGTDGLLCVLVAQSCPTLCDPMDSSPPGSSVHGILQARTLEWVAHPFSKGSSQPRDRTQVSHIAGRFFTVCATREGVMVWQMEGSYTEVNTQGGAIPHRIQQLVGRTQRRPSVPQGGSGYLLWGGGLMSDGLSYQDLIKPCN